MQSFFFVPIDQINRVFLLFGLLFPLAVGCSSEEGPPRYRVSGEVTFKGTPVPIGVIQFMPDTSQGNSGPPGFAEIKEGQFDTKLSGKGIIGGPHIVSIDAFNGKNIDPDMKPNGDPLVSGYQKRFALEKEADTELTIELTAR